MNKNCKRCLLFYIMILFTLEINYIVLSNNYVIAAEKSGLKNNNYRKDRILIKLKSTDGTLSDESIDFTNKTISNKLASRFKGIKRMDRLFSTKEKQNVKKAGTKSAWYSGGLEDGADVSKTIQEILKNPEVEAAEPDYIRHLDDDIIPNEQTDPKMAQQWYINKCGIRDAWSYLKSQGINPGGSHEVVVAVIDTGIDTKHPDLSGNLWTNTGEIPGDGKDNDNNGYIDDIHGACTLTGYHSGNVNDYNGHGTHVAGIIAAMGGNNQGGTGVAFNVRLMPVKAADANGELSSSDIADAVNYAVQNGADVINMSFGGEEPSQIEEDAYRNAYGSAVLIASAGNNSRNDDPNTVYGAVQGAPMFPAAYTWVIGVMAENQSPSMNGDNLANFSNWDSNPYDSYEYSIMAPGTDILSTIPGSKYAYKSGTSMAAPIVSGIAALVRSRFSDKTLYPTGFIMGQIISTGISKQGYTYASNKPSLYYKEANAYNALISAPKPQLELFQNIIIDDKYIDGKNNEDEVPNGGETIDIGLIIRNIWSKADNVVVSMDTKSDQGVSDPYAKFSDGYASVDYGTVDSYDFADNGLIYKDKAATRIEHPFRLKLADNIPNNYTVRVNVIITGNNGLDKNDNEQYKTSYSFDFNVINTKGDINLDGKTDNDDYIMLKNYLIDNMNSTIDSKGLNNADIDGDGLVTSRDYGLFKRGLTPFGK